MPGVYVSYPFCGQKCTYCNFASGVMPTSWEPEYLAALDRQIRAHVWQWTPETVYLGGGTPSRLAPDALRRMLEAIPGRPWREATIEAAPGGITPELASAWRDAGLTRVSLGVQSFDVRELRATGRRHDAASVLREVAVLRDAGLASINIDLILGLPHQTRTTWSESLDWVERIAPPHVSVYMLEVDEDSRLGLEVLQEGGRYGARARPSDDEVVEMHGVAVERLGSMGVGWYEISNFARPGAESVHNLKYWLREPYVGFGADAHGFDGAARTRNPESVREYLDGAAPVSEPASNDERLWLGLRLRSGVELGPGDERAEAELARFREAGLVEGDGRRVWLTPRGVLLSNEVFAALI